MKKNAKERGGFGTASMILGIIGLVVLGVPLGILAIILGSIGLSKNQNYSKTGIILGIADIILGILLFPFFMGFISGLIG